MPRNLTVIGRLSAAVLAGGVLIGCGAARPTPVTAVGQEAPAANVPLVDGTALRLAMEGDVVVVAFFTTWCPASAEMLRALDDIRARNKGPGLTTIALDEGDTSEQVRQFVRAKQLKVAVGFDTDGALAKQMSLPTVPALVVIDRRGTIRHVHAGYHGADDRAAFDNEISALLLEAAPEQAPEVVVAAE